MNYSHAKVIMFFKLIFSIGSRIVDETDIYTWSTMNGGKTCFVFQDFKFD